MYFPCIRVCAQEGIKVCPACGGGPLEAVPDLKKYKVLVHKRKSGAAKTVFCSSCKGTFAPKQLVDRIMSKEWEELKRSSDGGEAAAIGCIKEAIKEAEVLAGGRSIENPLQDKTVLSALRLLLNLLAPYSFARPVMH